MAPVHTVAGPVEHDQLGVTYMHEHVFILSPEVQAHWPGYNGWDEEREIEVARAKLLQLKTERGCDTIVDPTVAGLGRNVRAVARAAEGTGLNVVVATGYYVYDQLPLAFQFMPQEDRLERLMELFLSDIEHGIEGTGIKPGILKCCVHEKGLTPDVETVLRAVARVHLQTGVPIVTHTHPGTRRGRDQIAVFGEEGVDLRGVLIGHCNEAGSMEYLEQLLASGALIGFDRCGKASPDATPEQQVETLAALIRRGYADQVVLAHDHMSFIDWFPPAWIADKPPWHPYGYVRDELLPALDASGVAGGAVEQMLVHNPRRFFSCDGR